MKKPFLAAKACLAFCSLVAFLFFVSCSKQEDFMRPVMKLKVIETLPYNNDSSSRYDVNVSAIFNERIDTATYTVSFSLTKNDMVVNGKLYMERDILNFIPDTELLPSTTYSATLLISKKDNLAAVLYNYNWQFTTKEQDEFLMTQRSLHVTDFNRDGTRSMQIGNYLYSFGGWAVPEESFNDVYRSSGDLSTWEKLPNAPWHGRHVYGIAKIADSTYIIGGDNLQAGFDVWRTTDGLTWTQLSENVLNNRIFYGCTVHNGYIYIVGGLGYNDVWRSKNGIAWEQVSSDAGFLKGECFAGSLASFNGRLWMVCGGNNGFGQGSIRKEVWSSLDGKEWRQEKDFGGSKRYYTDVMVWDNKLWVVGGFNYEESNTKTIWYMKPDGSWNELATPDEYIGRHATALAVYNNQLTITCGNYNNDCWVIEKIK